MEGLFLAVDNSSCHACFGNGKMCRKSKVAFQGQSMPKATINCIQSMLGIIDAC